MKSVLLASLACLFAVPGFPHPAGQERLPQPRPQTPTTEERILETLRSPVPPAEIGVKLAAFTLKDPDSEALRLLIACEIDRSLTPDGSVALGYVLSDDKGAVVMKRFEQDVNSPLTANKTQVYVATAAAKPGVYTLQLAVIDASGKRGTAAVPVRAQLTQTGSIRSGDLLIADKAVGGSRANPSVTAEIVGDTLLGYVELYAEAADALKGVTADIEVAVTEDGRAIERSWLRVQDPSAAAPTRRIAEGTVLVAFLQPGSYVARAVISSGGRRIGQVSRPFRVARTSANVAPSPEARHVLTADTPTATDTPKPPADAATPAAEPVAIVSRSDVFERASVLTPPVLSFFLDKMNAGNRGATIPPAVLEAARTAQFDAALEAARGSSISQLATFFLTGLSLYGKGELNDAMKQFRETLRVDSEFFPAAFYLGACYAAGGRDSEAAGAWQTSLITLSDAPFIYTLIGDAFLRLHQNDSALEILTEASQRWPDSGAVHARLGIAYAAVGKRGEALDALDKYLAKHPDDHAALLVALRTLYEARSAGKPVATVADDRQRFDRYAGAYTAARGPQPALVDQWKKVVDR